MLVPVRIKTFGWRGFLNRLATKDQLKKRDLCLSIYEGVCVFCFQSDEDLNHLLFDCSFPKKVWDLMGSWIDFFEYFVGPP